MSRSSRVASSPLVIDVNPSKSFSSNNNVSGSSRLPGPPPLTRSFSELQLRKQHSQFSKKGAKQIKSPVKLWVAMLIGTAVQLLLFTTSSKTLAPLRWLLPTTSSRVGGIFLSSVIGSIYGALIWLSLVHFILPIWRLHLKGRTIWPLSCEEIRITDYKHQWTNWAHGIDQNLDAKTVAEEWGGMNGIQALRLMAAYQDKMTSNKCEFICLRYFPTPPPANHSSWWRYFTHQKEQRQKLDDLTNNRTPSNSSEQDTPSYRSGTPAVIGGQHPPLATPITPYPDLASLHTPALTTPFTNSDGTMLTSVPQDDTMALVFLTVLPNYDLRPYLPKVLSSLVTGFIRLWNGRQQVQNADASSSNVDSNSISMRLGLIGFQFPFRAGIFFTRPLPAYEPYARAFARPLTVAASTVGDDSSAREARASRYALVLQVLSDWNVTRSIRQRIDLLLHVTPSGSSSAVATQRAGMLPIPVPPSYIADLRDWSSAKWSAYLTQLRKEGKRIREAPFESAGGQCNFVASPELASTVVNMWNAVAKKQAEAGSSGPTLLKPTEQWVEALLTSDNNNNDQIPDTLAHVLELRLPQGLAATSIVCEFGKFLVTSDVAGFDYSMISEAEKLSGRKVGLYSVKLANVIRRAMARGVAFVDFGPTTGEAKQQVGCQCVPLYGAAICAQVHLLWIARLAASMVAFRQFTLPSIGGFVDQIRKRIINKVSTTSTPPVQDESTVRAERSSSSSAFVEVPTTSSAMSVSSTAPSSSASSVKDVGKKKQDERALKKEAKRRAHEAAQKKNTSKKENKQSSDHANQTDQTKQIKNQAQTKSSLSASGATVTEMNHSSESLPNHLGSSGLKLRRITEEKYEDEHENGREKSRLKSSEHKQMMQHSGQHRMNLADATDNMDLDNNVLVAAAAQ